MVMRHIVIAMLRSCRLKSMIVSATILLTILFYISSRTASTSAIRESVNAPKHSVRDNLQQPDFQNKKHHAGSKDADLNKNKAAIGFHVTQSHLTGEEKGRVADPLNAIKYQKRIDKSDIKADIQLVANTTGNKIGKVDYGSDRKPLHEKTDKAEVEQGLKVVKKNNDKARNGNTIHLAQSDRQNISLVKSKPEGELNKGIGMAHVAEDKFGSNVPRKQNVVQAKPDGNVHLAEGIGQIVGNQIPSKDKDEIKAKNLQVGEIVTLSVANQIEEEPFNNAKQINKPEVRGVSRSVINPHDFPYLINNETLCSTAMHLHHIIYFHSDPKTDYMRKDLRMSWAQKNMFPNLQSRIIFFMGRPAEESLLIKIRAESRQYGDIVMEDYKDAYNNMTHKAIGAMKWISSFCRNTKFVIKADQDVYVNMFKVIQVLTGEYAAKSRFMLCGIYHAGDMPILRKPQDCNKWCVPDHIFPGQKAYPTYCSGATYIFTSDIAGDLYTASLYVPYFYIDDVFVTGLLVQKVGNIKHYDMGHNSLRINGKHIRETMHEPNATYKVYGIHDPVSKNPKFYWKDHLQWLGEDQIALVGKDKYDALVKEANVTEHQDEK